MKEYVLFGVRVGDEDWQEVYITSAPDSKDGLGKIEKAKSWASSNGFNRLRVFQNDSNVAPDFKRTVK